MFSFRSNSVPKISNALWESLLAKAVVAHASKHCRLWQLLRPPGLVYDNANGTRFNARSSFNSSETFNYVLTQLIREQAK